MKSGFLVFLILFLDLVAFTIILPLFPSIIDYYGEHNASDVTLRYIYEALDYIRSALNMPDRRRYNNVLVGGILGSLFSFLQFISSPLIGACSDVYGRKNILIISMIGSCLSYAIWWKADTFTLFIISRVVGGLAKGSVTLCTAIISDISKNEGCAKGMAYIGLAFSCGFTSGPMIGAYFATRSATYQATNLFAFSAMIAIFFQIASIVLAWLFLEETMPKENRLSYSCTKVFRLMNPLRLFTFSGSQANRGGTSLQQLIHIYFLYILLFSGLEFTLPFLTHERFNFTGMQQGKLLFFAGIIMMFVQGGYVRRMKDNSEKKIALQGMAFLIPSMFIFSIAESVRTTYLAISIYSFGAATVVPCLTSLFTLHSKQYETGENIGVLRSAGAFARAVSPILSCSVYWSFGSSICYAMGGVLFVIPLIMLLVLRINYESKVDNKKVE